MSVLASLSALAYEPGLPHPVQELDFIKDDPEQLAFYHQAGFRNNYLKSPLRRMEMARRSAERTLEAANIDRSAIDTCIFVVSGFEQVPKYNPRELIRLLADLKIPKAYPLQLSGSNCANILAALQVAASLVQAGTARNILLLSADQPLQRSMYNQMSIKSDLALSCLVSPAGVGETELLSLAQAHNADQIHIVSDMKPDRTAYMMNKFKMVRNVAREALQSAGWTPDHQDLVFTQNYGTEVVKTLVELCGFKREQAWLDNIPKMAHATAGDVLVNLWDYLQEASPDSGSRFFLLADSITSCSAACLSWRKEEF